MKAQQAREVLLDQMIQTSQQEQPRKQYNIKTQERKFLERKKKFQHGMPYLQVLSNCKNHVEGSLPFFSMYANRVLEITTTKKKRGRGVHF